MLKKQYVSMRLLPIIVAFTLAFGCMAIVQRFDSYADEMPQDRLVVKGAKENVPWEYGYRNQDNWQTYILGTPINRLEMYDGNYATFAWTTTIENYRKCGTLTKISLTKTDDGSELASCTAADSEVGIQQSDFAYGLDEDLNELWPGMDLEEWGDYNSLLFNNIAIESEDTLWNMQPYHRDPDTYVAIQGTPAKIKSSTNYGFTVILYFNGSENAPAIPEEVQAVIDAIKRIGDITESNYLEEESAVTEAKALYDALESQTLKDQVTNYDTLTAAEISIAKFKLADAKTAAKQAIDDKYDLTKYSGEELAKLQKAISDAKAAIDAAETVKAVEAARDAGIAEADKAKTDEQIAKEALAAAKEAAKKAIDDKYDLTKYSGEELAKLEKAIADAKAAIDAAETVEAVDAAKTAGMAAADAAKTEEQIAEEKKKAEADKIKKQKAAAKKYKVAGLKVTSKSRKFTLTWKKTKSASGYQVQYRLKGSKKYKTLKNTTALKVTSKKLKKGKKYQFRIRAFTKINGSKVYGKWTAIKSVKCK